MKILLDEQLPVKLKYRLRPELNVSTVRDENWLGIKNGTLIQLAIANGFSIFISNDGNIDFQNKLTKLKILFINLNLPSNRYEDILPAVYKLKKWLIENEKEIETVIKLKNLSYLP